MHACMRTCIHTHTHTHTQTCMHACMHACIHLFIHMHTLRQMVLKDDTAKWAVAYKSVFSFNLGFGDEAGAKQTIDICGHRGNYTL